MARAREREALKAANRNRKWWLRVDKMSDSQVYAIFRRLQQQGKI